MAHQFDKPLPGETLLQYLVRHHCGLDDPLNEGLSAEEFDALAENMSDNDSGFIVSPGRLMNHKTRKN